VGEGEGEAGVGEGEGLNSGAGEVEGEGEGEEGVGEGEGEGEGEPEQAGFQGVSSQGMAPCRFGGRGEQGLVKGVFWQGLHTHPWLCGLCR
jgi:hypothetical protein